MLIVAAYWPIGSGEAFLDNNSVGKLGTSTSKFHALEHVRGLMLLMLLFTGRTRWQSYDNGMAEDMRGRKGGALVPTSRLSMPL